MADSPHAKPLADIPGALGSAIMVLVGAAGLGLEVVDGMQNNRMGQSVEAGLAIVIVAIMVDRLTQAWARRAEAKANLHV